MALSPSVLSGLIKANLQSVGAIGENLQKFCDAVAQGIVMSVIGKAFVTSDTGTITGVGTGTGIGILGLSSAIMKSTALSLMSSQGENADKLMNAIMTATVTHLSTAALLTSAHAPVFVGTGLIVVGTITVNTGEMSGNIDAQLAATGAQGVNRTNLATAIGTGVASNIIAMGTGTVVITGSITIPPPLPGAGAGAGTIS